MSNHTELDTDYCPRCGRRVKRAEAVTVDGELSIDGTFERWAVPREERIGGSDDHYPNAHLDVEGSEIRIYEHADDNDGGPA